MSVFSELLISALLLIGAAFMLVGSLGLARLADPLQRLHGPTKATTLGISAILVASMLYQYLGHGKLSFHEFLIVFFLFITAPISAHLLAKAYLHIRRVERD